MQPGVKSLKDKKLIGKRLTMSLVNNKTVELWKSFMPGHREITNNLTNDLISIHFWNLDSKFERKDMDTYTTEIKRQPTDNRQRQ